MRFKILSVGWRCADFFEQTLRSIESQSVDNWDVGITYDPSDDDGAKRIAEWCESHDARWNCTLNGSRKFAVRNQAETIQRLDPDDDDIVVFLDLDGDQLAHPDVLAHLAEHYADGTLLTYGNYRPVPYAASCPLAVPFPADVLKTGSYRKHMLTGACCFNHLRTMSGRIAKAIPPDHFQWIDGPKTGEYYEAGTDYIFMVAGLELAGGRHKCLDEVLLLYNNANPNADYLSHPAEADACVQNYLRRRPLEPLGPTKIKIKERAVSTTEDPYLPPEQRRAILREYGRRFGLRVFIETGTNTGDTPAALMDDFDQIFTIEVGESLYRAACKRFQGTNVVCLHGDSATLLAQQLIRIDEPVLMWLDGHFCGDARALKDTPIIEELEGIFGVGIRRSEMGLRSLPHVILIDDARLFQGMSHYGEHDWPHIDEVRSLAELNGYTCEIADDIVRLVPKS